VYELEKMIVWNYNETLPGRPELLLRGASSADISLAGSDGVFTLFAANVPLDLAPGSDEIDFGQSINLESSARYIRFDIHGNHGGDNNFVGLSEVKFFGVPEPASWMLALVGGAAALVASRLPRGNRREA
jgi:hypothetical protein